MYFNHEGPSAFTKRTKKMEVGRFLVITVSVAKRPSWVGSLNRY
jgi:hypothetical protein